MTTETEVTEEAQTEEQLKLIPDEIVEEDEVREIMIPLKAHEVLELVDRMASTNEELKGHMADKEKEKSRHKENKEAIESRIDTTTEKLSGLIDMAGMRKRKSLEKTKKRTNHSTKMVEWYWTDPQTGETIVADSRPMVPAEYQLKLAIDQSQPDNVVSITDGEAAGDDPASFDEGHQEEAEPANVEAFDEAAGEATEDHELGDNVIDDSEFEAPSEKQDA